MDSLLLPVDGGQMVGVSKKNKELLPLECSQWLLFVMELLSKLPQVKIRENGQNRGVGEEGVKDSNDIFSGERT